MSLVLLISAVSEQLTVGVGALAGSTIMLLTIPWFLSVMGGRVNIDGITGKASYKTPKLTPAGNFSLWETGVSLSPAVNTCSLIMIGTSVTYMLLQVPGMMYLNSSVEEQVAGEHFYSLIGACMCLLFFVSYLYYQYKIALDDSADTIQAQTRDAYFREAIVSGKITLSGAMCSFFEGDPSFLQQNAKSRTPSPGGNATTAAGKTERSILLRSSSSHVSDASRARLDRLLKPFFAEYDRVGFKIIYIVFLLLPSLILTHSSCTVC